MYTNYWSFSNIGIKHFKMRDFAYCPEYGSCVQFKPPTESVIIRLCLTVIDSNDLHPFAVYMVLKGCGPLHCRGVTGDKFIESFCNTKQCTITLHKRLQFYWEVCPPPQTTGEMIILIGVRTISWSWNMNWIVLTRLLICYWSEAKSAYMASCQKQT